MLHNPPNELYWCTSHRREATHKRADGQPCCDPKLSGILLPCHCVSYKLNEEAIRAGQSSTKHTDQFIATLEIAQQQKKEDHIVRINGKAFYCSCGCNVFHHPDDSDDNLWQCNACETQYQSEK
jgi:hypothetical protein